jgi:hypothetical protein
VGSARKVLFKRWQAGKELQLGFNGTASSHHASSCQPRISEQGLAVQDRPVCPVSASTLVRV